LVNLSLTHLISVESELVDEELILKMVVQDKAPKRIHYFVSDKGLELLKIIDDLHKWGLKWQ